MKLLQQYSDLVKIILITVEKEFSVGFLIL